MAAAATTPFELVSRDFIGELGGVPTMLAAVRVTGLDLARALFVPAFLFDVIDFHGYLLKLCRPHATSALLQRVLRRVRVFERIAGARPRQVGVQCAAHRFRHAFEQQVLDADVIVKILDVT